jgi:hypothetical protein
MPSGENGLEPRGIDCLPPEALAKMSTSSTLILAGLPCRIANRKLEPATASCWVLKMALLPKRA